jgi:hypothetical protein
LLENSLFTSLFPRTAKRQARPAESIFDFDVNANIPLGHDLPENGGITGNMPYAADDISIAAPDERVNVEQIDTPNIVDDGVAIEQGGATTQPFVPTQQELTSDTSGISSLGKMPTMGTEQPEFALPYPQPTSMYEQTQNALAQGQFDAQNPRNRDKGFKGALKEALQNFAFGLSHAQPGMGFWESMALGGTGLGMGIADRSANERRDAMRKLPMLQQNAKIASDEMDAVATRKLRDAQVKNYERDDAYRVEKAEQDAIDKAASEIFKSKVFSKTNPAHRARAQRAGLDPDAIGDFDFSNPVKTTVNGTVFNYNRATGEWDVSNLPSSEKDKIVSIDISVPGETNADGSQKIRKFNVPQSQAATMSASLQAAGMQIQAASDRQTQGFAHDEKMTRLRADIAKSAAEFKAKLDESSAEKDQTRKLALQQEAERLRQITVNLRKELDGVDQ